MTNKKLSAIAVGIISALCIFLTAGNVMAASFNLPVTANNVKIGDKLSANIQIDSEGSTINAGQATLNFPANILQVDSFDKLNSVFSFWLQDPTLSNADGTLSFAAGSTSGFAGPSLQVLTVNFSAISNGTANIVLTNGAISAADGSGTNVLSKLNGAVITVSPKVTAPAIAAVPAPVQITRPVAPATGLPIKPVLTVPLYPDSTAWYNLSSVFFASWALPADVSDVATAINKNPTYTPKTSEGLFNNKSFPALDSGIWYLHVRFGNSIGWGPTAHYRLAVDTLPPTAFDAKLSQGASSDNPAPSVSFSTGDPLSGVKSYYVKIDSADKIIIQGSPYTLPPQKPGKHSLIVGVQDGAGNITEDTIQFEILPIQAPIITSVSNNIYSGEGGLVISGQSLPNISILVAVKGQAGNLVYSFTAVSTGDGKWGTKFDTPLKNGTYYVEATAKDSRGALSLPVKSGLINVVDRPLMIILGVPITATEMIVLLLLILIGGYIIGWYTGNLISNKMARRILISQRDVSASFNVIRNDVDSALKAWDDKKVESYELTQIEFLLRRVKENIEKLQKYIITGIKDIGRK